MDILKESNGEYSVRKFGGYMSLILLAYLNISFTIANGFKIAVPAIYLVSIDVIIGFYFFKNTLSNLRLNAKVDDAVVNKITTETIEKESKSVLINNSGNENE